MDRFFLRKINCHIEMNHSIHYFPITFTEYFHSVFFIFKSISIHNKLQLLKSKNFYSSILFCPKMRGE